MIDHVSITVADLERARRFYDAVMATLGQPVRFAEADAVGYGPAADADAPERSYLTVRAGLAGTSDRRHWAFKAADRATVDAFHRAGLAAGGRCDGPPGPRPHYHQSYYAAFLLDPDGNRIEAVCHAAENATSGPGPLVETHQPAPIA